MATFQYKALGKDGETVSGVLEAYDEFEAVGQIKATCPVVTSIFQVESASKQPKHLFGMPPVGLKNLALMCSQFSIILRAGLPVVRCVELIASQTTDNQLKRILGEVASDVASGYSLAASFENKGRGLPVTFMETVRAGEDSGTLEVAFRKLHKYYDAAGKTEAKVRSAMLYPAFMGILAVVVVGIIMTVTMPVFSGVFDSAGAELPAATRALVGISDFFSRYGWAVLLAVLLLAGGSKLYGNTEQGRLGLAKLQLRLPYLGNVAKMRSASQFANTMATMLAAGHSIVRTVAVTAKTLENYHMSLELSAVVGRLEEGWRLTDCLRSCGVFPDLLVEMTGVGEDTGALEDTLDTIGAYYDSEVEIASQKALGALQPIITVVLGLAIGFIVVALYLPMFGMYNMI